MRSCITLVLLTLCGAVAQAQSDTNQIMGQLGYPVGTELMIEGTFQAGKNSWLLVSKVNGKDLPEPKLIPTDNLAPSAKIMTNTLCRFKGVEITYVVKSVVDPKTGQECQQASPGRHIDFQVTDVLAPEGVKVRTELQSLSPVPSLGLVDAVHVAEAYLKEKKIDTSKHYLDNVRLQYSSSWMKGKHWIVAWKLKIMAADGGELFVFVDMDKNAKLTYGE